jgi:FeS assembly SUF system regulator
MFRLNRLTDYAVVVMAQMAQRGEEMRTALQISQDTGVPQPTVAKLLSALARGDLVASHRGAAGGFTLSRMADEITVAEIIQALEGPIALTACVDGSGGHCGSETFCPMRGNWDKVNQAIHGALSKVTLADMSISFAPVGAPAEAQDGARQNAH